MPEKEHEFQSKKFSRSSFIIVAEECHHITKHVLQPSKCFDFSLLIYPTDKIPTKSMNELHLILQIFKAPMIKSKLYHLKEFRTCHPQICYFGTLIILS